jgi:hypothetical protein
MPTPSSRIWRTARARRVRVRDQAQAADLIEDYARLRYGGHRERTVAEARLRTQASELLRRRVNREEGRRGG